MILKKPQILLVEDDKFIARAYKDGLELANFNVLLADNGQEAVEKIKNQKPNLVLLDLILPNKDGFEVLEEIKMDHKLRKIPILVLSNLEQESDKEKCKELGAVEYLIKSNFSLDQVIEKVKFYLAKTS